MTNRGTNHHQKTSSGGRTTQVAKAGVAYAFFDSPESMKAIEKNLQMIRSMKYAQTPEKLELTLSEGAKGLKL